MKQMHWFVVTAAGLGLAGAARPALGESVLHYKTAYNARFISGYGATAPLVTPPVPNASPLFLLAGYDLSGLGWATNDTSHNATMISPGNFAQANHWQIGYVAGSSMTFMSHTGQLYATALADYQHGNTYLLGDANLGTLPAPLPNSAHVSYFPVIDRGDTPAGYVGTTAYIYGNYGVVGSTTFSGAYGTWDNASTGIWSNSWSFGAVQVEGGDSSSPSFMIGNGQPALAGTRSGTFGSNYSGGVDAAWMNPYTIARADAAMAAGGYAIRVLAVPAKNWAGTTAGTSNFNDANNWVEGAAPAKEAVAFDGSVANRNFNVNFDASPSVKGITFTSAGISPSGFTFSGSTLPLGTGGIVNNDTQTQTFNNDISMYYLIDFDTHNPTVVAGAQHWSANAGNIVVNGGVTNNGFQLVVDGAKDTALNGAISGAGGVGKEGTGKLTLAHANTYSGNTTLSNGTLAVNNATGSGTGFGNVVVWGGRLQGKGTINGAVLFHANGDPTTLAPGNADLGQTGQLTLNHGVTLSATTTAEFHIHGLTPGNEFDQLLVTGGDVDLGHALLNVLADTNFTTAPTTEFWLINNTGNGLLRNQFANFANGALVTTIGGAGFYIYYGADFASNSLTGGNDVVLAIPEPLSLGLLVLGGLGLLGRSKKKGPWGC